MHTTSIEPSDGHDAENFSYHYEWPGSENCDRVVRGDQDHVHTGDVPLTPYAERKCLQGRNTGAAAKDVPDREED